jgi:hypothetical protein
VWFVFLLVGCGGWRSGIASMPYVGEVASAPETPEDTYVPRQDEVKLPGVTLKIRLNNTIQTNDFAVMLFVVPIHFDPREKPIFKETDRFTVSLTIIPADSEFVFDPSGVIVTVDGQVFGPITTRLDNYEKMGAYFKSSSGAPYDRTLLSDLVDRKITLIKEKYYGLTITFDCPIPTPERAITLNIGRALLHPKLPNAPTIRFKKIRWKQGYT